MNQIKDIARIKFATNWRFPKPDAVNTEGISLTVPDQSYSIREILTKFTRMPEIMTDQVYDGLESDIDFDDPVISQFQDLTDMDFTSYQLQQIRQAQYERKQKAAADKAAADQLKMQNSQPQTPLTGS